MKKVLVTGKSSLTIKYKVEGCAVCKSGKLESIGHKITTYHQDKEIIDCTQSIMKTFEANNEALLIAQSQSGKSDVIKRILELRNYNADHFKKKYKIESIYVIICASANDLKSDQIMEFHNFTNGQKNVLHLNDLIRIVSLFNNNKETSFEVEAKANSAASMDIVMFEEMRKNSLLIFDESHADLEEQATIDKFRKLLDIEFGIHTNESIKVLNISATAYDQFKAGIKTTFLKPRRGYYGIKDMFNKGKLFQGFNLSKYEDFVTWCQHMLEQLSTDSLPIGYYIMRVDDTKSDTKIRQNLDKYFKNNKKAYCIDSYNMKKIYDYDINIRYLDKKPNKPTFIIIMNKLRKGNRINKTYIIATHDKPKNTLTHTTYQGLVGRMTGYNGNKNSLIYCDYGKAKEHLGWILSNYSIDKIPGHAQWIKKDGTISIKSMLHVASK